MSLKVGGLFAGYGGLDLAVSQVFDAEPAWFSEFDKGPSKILAHRFPDVPNHGDITKIDWSQVEPVDILTGGSPCQDLSHAGKRQGMNEGTRSNLWVAMREAIAELRPAYVIWENVRGAYSAEANSALESDPRLLADTRRRDGEPVLRALGRVLGDLSDLGYDARWHGIRAADVGAPHGRFRVFVVATDASGLRRGERWAARSGETSGGWASADSARRGDAPLRVLPTPTTRDWKDHTIRREPHRPDDVDTLARALTDVPCALLPTPTSADDGARWGDYAAAIQRWEQRLYAQDRIAEQLLIPNYITLGRPAPAPTMTSSKGNPQLAPAFVEWMMGLPAGWVTDVPGITRNEALKALGNGVVPQQAAHALRVMLSWAEVAA